ncbi:MAG: hypothetical protein JXR73_22540 [Candidatus Omnitrophica bacterium]|nr:hypothetical protein [Candidatus Omnitrophota bacterium]
MVKRNAVWKREIPCLVCETPMVNYQFMTKSQTIVYDDWMVAHMHPVGDYGAYPEELKTTVCPACLTASNEYNYGVDQRAYFSRNTRKNNQIKGMFEQCCDDRFGLLAREFDRFEKESALLDTQHNRPANTRAKATFEKIWTHREEYGIPFFTLMFEPPRDFVTTLVCFALDRYCQMAQICYHLDIEASSWEYEALSDAIEEKLTNQPLSMKSGEPRFYFVATNYLQSLQFLIKMKQNLYPEQEGPHDELIDHYWREAYRFSKLSYANDDLSAVPCEVKEGGAHLLMARLHFRFEMDDDGIRCLRQAKKYADNRLRHISSLNQQKFVNDVEDLTKKYLTKNNG